MREDVRTYLLSMRIIELNARHTGFFRSVVTKKRRESTHARNSPFKIPSKMRACADSRRFFVTTDLKNPVQGFSSWLSKCNFCNFAHAYLFTAKILSLVSSEAEPGVV